MSKAPSTRRAARETALRVLYTIDAGKQPVEEVLAESAEAAELDEKALAFLETLVNGVLRSRREIDTEIDRFAIGFPVDRQAVVDRNILRLATAEILYSVSDAPAGAVVNEAVELAKKYSTKESGKFVNGVLGALVRDHETKRGVPADEVTEIPDVSDDPEDEEELPDDELTEEEADV